jgi:hypothetical protein
MKDFPVTPAPIPQQQPEIGVLGLTDVFELAKDTGRRIVSLPARSAPLIPAAAVRTAAFRMKSLLSEDSRVDSQAELLLFESFKRTFEKFVAFADSIESRQATSLLPLFSCSGRLVMVPKRKDQS